MFFLVRHEPYAWFVSWRTRNTSRILRNSVGTLQALYENCFQGWFPSVKFGLISFLVYINNKIFVFVAISFTQNRHENNSKQRQWHKLYNWFYSPIKAILFRNNIRYDTNVCYYSRSIYQQRFVAPPILRLDVTSRSYIIWHHRRCARH